MKKLTLALVTLLLVSGCDDMSGLLKVSEKFSVLVKGKSKEIPVGTHNTELDFEREKITATVDVNGQDIKVVILLPNSVSLPENGPFAVKSEQSGQPFDIEGTVRTEMTRSELKNGRESCQYYSQEPICDQNGCTIQNVPRTGWRDIEYFEETTEKQLQFDSLSKAGLSQSHFEGASNTTIKRVTFEGRCF